MAERKGGLGRGLAALIPSAPADIDKEGKTPGIGGGASDVIFGKQQQRDDAPKATPKAPTTTTTTPAVAETATTVNINAVLGPVLALLAVTGIGAAGVYALNALGVLK